MFQHAYSGKKVLVTGHTGFKGSWLSAWLETLGAEVFGYSLGIPTNPSNFEAIRLSDHVNHIIGDIRNASLVSEVIKSVKPDFIFHLAAQPLVSLSYRDPAMTIETNVMGTMNVLSALRDVDHPCTCICITSDKCYENKEWIWGYRETDQLGGKDVYSASKGAAELIFHAFHSSYFKDASNTPCRLATVRAGNVIGGGDWAQDRIVADAIRAWSRGERVKIRSPKATRPWQHVLEPLSGYLALAANLHENPKLHGESFNFGPRESQNQSVYDLLVALSGRWGIGSPNDAIEIIESPSFHEAGLLKLNCDKALFHLNWRPALMFEETIAFVGDWYRQFYDMQDSDLYSFTIGQIAEYVKKAQREDLLWARSKSIN